MIRSTKRLQSIAKRSFSTPAAAPAAPVTATVVPPTPNAAPPKPAEPALTRVSAFCLSLQKYMQSFLFATELPCSNIRSELLLTFETFSLFT